MSLQDMFAALEAQYGLPPGYLARTYQIESGGNPNAQNPNSSAGGGFQFIDSTAQQYGLTDKFNIEASAGAAARLARDNAAQLRGVLGREPTAAELYFAHQQGGSGATRLLGNPNAMAADIVGADAVRLNGGDANMTAGQFANLWLGKFDGTRSALPSQYAPQATPAMPGPLAMQPADPFEDMGLLSQFAASRGIAQDAGAAPIANLFNIITQKKDPRLAEMAKQRGGFFGLLGA